MRRGLLNSIFTLGARAPLAGALGLLLTAGCGSVDDGATGGNDDANTPDDGTADDNGTVSPPATDDGPVATDDGPVATDDGPVDDSSGGGMGFIDEPDGGGVNNECDLWAQDCPKNEKCMPWANDGGGSWNATRCSPIDDNPGQPGDTCTVEGSGVSGIDDCDIAAMCWDVDPKTNLGTCVAFCEGTEDAPLCSNPDEGCSITNDGVLILCLAFCDPLLQDCPEGNACYPENNGFFCSPDASGAEMGAIGDPCEFINVCDAGGWCAAAETVPDCVGSAGCCAAYCDFSDPNATATCPAGTECVAWYEEGSAPPGEEDIGVCILPQT